MGNRGDGRRAAPRAFRRRRRPGLHPADSRRRPARLAVEQKICLLEDAETARAAARKELARYMTLDNYRNNWLRSGFGTEDMENGGSDRLMDAMVAWGTAETVAARLRAHFDAGADQVCIQPIAAAGPPDWRGLEAVVEAAGGP